MLNMCNKFHYIFSSKAKIIVSLVVLIMTAVLITVVNVLVIIVLSTTKELLYTSQSIYKLSLAAADLLVGVVVMPTSIYSFIKYFFHPISPSNTTRIVTGYQEINGSYVKMNKTVINVMYFQDVNYHGHNFVGFMTSMSILTSVYTLAAASFDRFFAVYKPFSYNKGKAVRYAKVATAVLWLSTGLVSLLPIVTSSNILYYFFQPFLHLVLISDRNHGNNAVSLYVVILFIPLIIVWITSISIFVIIKRHSRNFQQNHPSVSHIIRNNQVEKHLTITLSLITGVFTINNLPGLVAILLGQHFISLVNVYIFNVVSLISIILLFGNSFCNFFIYNARNKDFQKALKQIIKCVINKLVCKRAT